MDITELQGQQTLLIIEINNLKIRRDELLSAKNSKADMENSNLLSLHSSYNREILDIKKKLVVVAKKLMETNKKIESELKTNPS